VSIYCPLFQNEPTTVRSSCNIGRLMGGAVIWQLAASLWR